MTTQSPKLRRIVLALIALILITGSIVFYLFSIQHRDMALEKAAYRVPAQELVAEFLSNDRAANKKYAEKIIEVKGRVTSIEQADSTMNVKMEFPTGSYLSFAFQPGDLEAVKKIRSGDSITVKGSCNGGNYSSILDAEYITFKRCTLQP